MMDIIHYRE